MRLSSAFICAGVLFTAGTAMAADTTTQVRPTLSPSAMARPTTARPALPAGVTPGTRPALPAGVTPPAGFTSGTRPTPPAGFTPPARPKP